jgi:hypothetical protein
LDCGRLRCLLWLSHTVNNARMEAVTAAPSLPTWLDPVLVARRKRPVGFDPLEPDLIQDVPDDFVFPTEDSLVDEITGPMTILQVQGAEVDKVAVYLRELKYRWGARC